MNICYSRQAGHVMGSREMKEVGANTLEISTTTINTNINTHGGSPCWKRPGCDYKCWCTECTGMGTGTGPLCWDTKEHCEKIGCLHN